jgi:hypothetical protein
MMGSCASENAQDIPNRLSSVSLERVIVEGNCGDMYWRGVEWSVGFILC